jgi:hypothetical protein
MLAPNQKISLSRPVEDETEDEPTIESEDMAEDQVAPPPTARANPHTQLDEIADATKAGVPVDLIVHEANLEASQ